MKIVEGTLRCTELKEYLLNLGAENIVWLCEDATGINSKMEYDPKTNQIVGLVLPIDKQSGMPISNSFLAKSVEDIQKYVKNPVSIHVYVVLAQPLKENAPPFVLQIFGTDSKFTAKDVTRRWQHTIGELKR